MFWLGVIVGALPAALIATLVAYDRGMNRAHREWTARDFNKLQETKYQLGLAGLSIRNDQL